MNSKMELLVISEYVSLYKYLPVLTAQQINKLAKISMGIRDLSAFTEDEIYLLEVKLQLVQDSNH